MKSTSEKYTRRGLRTSYISTVIGISLVLFMMGLVISGSFLVDTAETQAKESLSGDIFFKPEFTEVDIKQVEQEIRNWEEFSSVTFVSSDKAIEELTGLGNSSEEILAILDGENPIPANISFSPKSKNATAEGMKTIKEKLLESYPDKIDEVYFDESSVADVNLGFKQFVFLFAVVALLLIVVAVAMINNTIRLALYSKRFTIKTMQLVGAKSNFIRRPFLWQSVLQGIVSALLGFALILVLLYTINRLISAVEITLTWQSYSLLFGALIVLGIVISYISTWFALNKYLRMRMDDLY